MIRSYLLHCYKFQFRTLAKPYKRKGNDLSHSWTKVQHVYMRALNIDIWHFQLMKTIEKWESMMLSDTRSIKIRKHTIRMGYSLWLYSFIKRQVVKIGRQKAFHELWVRNNFGTFFFLCVATNHHFHHLLQLHTFSVRDSVRVNMLWAVYNIHDNNYGLECSISEVFANEHKKTNNNNNDNAHTLLSNSSFGNQRECVRALCYGLSSLSSPHRKETELSNVLRLELVLRRV